MTGLDIFALIVLFVLFIVVIGGVILLGMLPGRIAIRRQHPQAEAINICGWMGILTLGILLPLAYIWAYTKSEAVQQQPVKEENES